MRIENRNLNWKKIGITILSVSLISGIGFVGYKYVESNNRVEAQRVADAKEKAVETKTNQISNAIVLADVKSKVEKSLSDGSKLEQEELDRLTYYLYQYMQHGYRFLGTDDEFDIGVKVFIDLKKLYGQSDLEAPFIHNSDNGEITFIRDVPKPKDYQKKIDEVKQVSKDKAKGVIESKSGGVKLESEGIIE